MKAYMKLAGLLALLASTAGIMASQKPPERPVSIVSTPEFAKLYQALKEHLLYGGGGKGIIQKFWDVVINVIEEYKHNVADAKDLSHKIIYELSPLESMSGSGGYLFQEWMASGTKDEREERKRVLQALKGLAAQKI
jgi:hypothetical protein